MFNAQQSHMSLPLYILKPFFPCLNFNLVSVFKINSVSSKCRLPSCQEKQNLSSKLQSPLCLYSFFFLSILLLIHNFLIFLLMVKFECMSCCLSSLFGIQGALGGLWCNAHSITRDNKQGSCKVASTLLWCSDCSQDHTTTMYV